MRKYLLLPIGILCGALLIFPMIGEAQGVNLWKYVGNLRPVVSSWRVDSPGGLSGATVMTASHLRSCNTIDTDGAGVFSCGTDDTGGGGGAFTSTGALQAAFDNRYVNIAGDSMTGGLIIKNGNPAATIDTGLMLEVIGMGSGRVLHAQDGLTSSGTFATRGAAHFYSTLKLNGITYTFPFGDGSASGKVLKTNAAGQLSWSTDATGAGSTYTAGQGLTLNASNAFSVNATLTGTTLRGWRTISGSSVQADYSLASSGSLAVRQTSYFYGPLKLGTGAAIKYYFPTADGSASGKVLATNGAGQLSWTNKDLTMKAKTADYTANVGELVLADAAAVAGFQVTLPTSTSSGARVGVKLTNTSGTRTVRVAGSQTSLNIQDRETATGSILLYVKGDYIELKHDGTRWNIVSEGRIPHKAVLRRDAAQSIAASTEVKIAFDAETFDVGQLGDFTTNDRVDIRRPGKYTVSVGYGMSIGTDKASISEILVNGTIVRENTFYNPFDAGINNNFGGTVLSLATGDFVEFYVLHTNVASTDTSTSTASRPNLFVTEIFP